jgi:hypothetical protein
MSRKSFAHMNISSNTILEIIRRFGFALPLILRIY